MKKIGIMGGTFNPIHLGHLLLAERAYEEYDLEQIVFLPSRKPAYKDCNQLASQEQRKKMIELAIQEKSYFSLSTLEYEREGNTYTIDTMRDLRKRHPETKLYFLIGADSLFQLQNWKDAALLMKMTHFLVASRNRATCDQMEAHAHALREQYGAKIDFLCMPNMEISSSEIRKRCQKGNSISYLVPESVETYINQVKLYQG